MKQTFHIAEPLYEQLRRHLFPGDQDEHGAVILAGIAESDRSTRFLAREVVLAEDGVDYVPGKRGYRALTADFVARISDRCALENLCHFAAHCHGGDDQVSFSNMDLASQRRGYPALLDITNGGPVGALVFAENAAEGNVWRRSGVTALDRLTVIGPNLRRLFPCSSGLAQEIDPIYHRQSLLFGERGQLALSEAKVAVIGLGGAGSLVSQWLAHLGVGHIIGVDFDGLEPSNRPRVVGTTPWDAGEPFAKSRFSIVRRLGARLAKRKVHVAARVARLANPKVLYEPIVGDVSDMAVARRLTDADYIFLCADSMKARLVFNALSHQYLIPGAQIGSKVPVEKKTGAVKEVFLVSRRVLPYSGGGCLSCNQLIPPDLLREESLTLRERRAQAYVADNGVAAPSVITLNALAAAQAINDFLFSFHGLIEPYSQDGYMMHYPRERSWIPVSCASDRECLHCGSGRISAYALGDRGSLPCKQ